MLTQKMSKEIMLLGRGVNVVENESNLRKTAALFDQTIKGLLYGDAELGLVKTENPPIVKQLKKVERLWWKFQRSVVVVLAGNTSRRVLGTVAAQDMSLLVEMDKAVKMYEKASDSHLPQKKAVTINLAGKQRMLTQKMTKELLLIANAIRLEENKARLKETVSLFDRTLKGLLDGDKALGLPGTNDVAIRTQLTVVEKLWKEYKPVLDKIDISDAGLEKADQINMPLLNEMNKAVQMYTNF